jgi:ankyrin repeat protein
MFHTVLFLQGVDINQQIDGRLPLHYASDYGQLEVLKFLCQKVIFEQSCFQILKLFFLYQSAQLNSADKHGISPLLAAIWEGHTSCVQFLLEKVRKNTRCLQFLC